MQVQNYANHRRIFTKSNIFLLLPIFITLIGASINLSRSFSKPDVLYSASLVFALSLILFFMYFFVKGFAIRVQDRTIRTEENLRHFILTGKPLDRHLTLRQIIGLRFAEDEEFIELAKKAVT